MGERPGPVLMRPRRPLDPASIGGATDDEVLRRFVVSVRRWRGRGASTSRFRCDDLVALAGTIGADPGEIERRLIALTGCDRATAKRLRRMLLISLATLPIATTAAAVGPPSGGRDATAPMSRKVEEARFTPIAVAVPEPVAAPTATAAPVVDPPAAPTPEPPAPPPTAVVPGSEATVAIDRLGIDLPVVAGGQAVIDEGVVAHYWAPGWRDPAAAGTAGTYWLAAHHETHGSPFLRLPEVVVGDRIEVTTATQTFTYTVTSTEVVEDDAGFGPVYGTDPDAPVILLQTCLDDVRRLLVHGALTAVG